MRTHRRSSAALGLLLAIALGACAGEPATDQQAEVSTPDTATQTAPGDDSTDTGEPQELVEVTFGGSVTWLGHVPVMVAVEQGFFEDEGIDLNYEVILASADRLAALTSGDVDFSNLGRSVVISAMAQGNESFCYWANIDDSPGHDGLYAAPGIETVEDLRGRPVAANTSAKVTLTHILQDHGMTLDDIQYVDLAATDMALALSNGDVDAVDVWRPPLDDVMAAVPDGKLLAWDTDTTYYEEFGTASAPDIVIMRRGLVDEDEELARGIARAVFRGVQFAQDNPEGTAESVAHYFQQEPEEVLEGMETFQYFGLDVFDEHMEKHEEQAEYLANWFDEEGIIDTVPEVRNWACYDFVDGIEI